MEKVGRKVGVEPSPRVDTKDVSLNSTTTRINKNIQERDKGKKAQNNRKKQKRPSLNDNACNRLTSVDIFGSEYRWNVEG